MNKNIEKFINYIPELNNLFQSNLNKLKNSIIRNIIKSENYELFFSHNIKNFTNIFSNFDGSLLILNFSDNNENASKYIMNKIKELFCQNDDKQFFIGFLKKEIINQYIFDTILKIISFKNDKNFIEANKSTIFESINDYSIKNAYYYVDSLLKFLKKYLPLEEMKSLIEDKYLILNCLNNFKKNYETIAVLLNYCPSVRIYFYVFPFLYDININSFMLFEESNYLEFFSKLENRELIKSLNKNS